jgi:hypothetical protein
MPPPIAGQLAGSIGPFRDPATGHTVELCIRGRFSARTAEPRDPNELCATVQRSLLGATRAVLLGKPPVAIPTSRDLSALVPEIVQASQLAAAGIDVQQLELVVETQASRLASADFVRSAVLRWAIGCVITLLATLFLLAIAWYVYSEVMATARGIAPA